MIDLPDVYRNTLDKSVQSAHQQGVILQAEPAQVKNRVIAHLFCEKTHWVIQLREDTSPEVWMKLMNKGLEYVLRERRKQL